MIPLLLAASLQLVSTRESLVATYRRYAQTIDGRVVVGTEVVEETRHGKTRVIHERLAREPQWGGGAHAAAAALSDNVVYVNVDGEARLARREIVRPRPLEPHAMYYDAETGALLRDDPMFFAARVFDVNPVKKLNDPSLRDRNNAAAAVPDSAYSNADITTISGPFATIVDTQEPFTRHPTTSFDFDRNKPEFEDVNAYFQIDRSQRYLQSLGYIGARRLVDYSIPIDAHAANGTDNSFYLQQTPPGHGALYFGDGGTDDAEDPDIMLHEFFHAVQDWIAPGALAGPSKSEARAISEGTADYWAFSSSYAGAKASGRDPYCIADWDARCGGDDASQQCGYSEGADCLRRVDSTRTMANYNSSNVPGSEYDNAAIWSSALREIFLKIGKAATDTLTVESLFGVPPQPSFKFVAQKMIEADVALNAGANASAICSAMTSRGILAANECFAPPRGEWTVFTSLETNIAIPDAGSPIELSLFINDGRVIDRLAVRVDIDHPVRGDLVITLVTPNGTEVQIKPALDVDRTPGVHATFEVDALRGVAAIGQWKLRVQDLFAGDVGTLRSWGLLIQFAGDAPFVARPTSATRRVIPVVAHIAGAGGITWTSDVWLFNRGTSATDATLIFTPSQHDGTIDFAALKFHVDSGQVITIRDVVDQMHMLGGGQLEIDGDVVAGSRIHGGGYEFVPAVSTDVAAMKRLLSIRSDATTRTNIGFAETSGQPAHVIWSRGTVDVPPFSHVQIPVSGGAPITIDGNVIAYASVVDNRSNDTTVEIAAPPVADAPRYAPVIGGGGWLSELYFTSVRFDVAGGGIRLQSEVQPVFGRIVHDTFVESLPFQFVPLVKGDLIGVENSDQFRTNIVLASIGDFTRLVTVRDFDAAGHVLRDQVLRIAPSEVVIVPLATPAARVFVDGNVFAYASVIDRSNGDPMLIPLQ